jgi:hypothetical protein
MDVTGNDGTPAGMPSDSSPASTTILRIEHPVLDYAAWKAAFDSDPIGRERSGVRRYQIQRAIDDPNYVLIDLEFDSHHQAQAVLAALRVVWERVAGTIMANPQARIVEPVETKQYPLPASY